MSFRLPYLASLIVCFLLISIAVTTHADSTATVSGVSKLFVRRGPGNEFPPFASLSEGSVVSVQSTEGQWARIQTANGQVGYVPNRYLVSGAAAGPETHPPTPTHAALPTYTRPAATATHRNTPVVKPTNTARPSATLRSTSTPRATATTRATSTPRPSRTPLATATEALARSTPTHTEAVRGSASAMASPTESATPSPTDSPALAMGDASGSRPEPASYDGAIHDELRQLRIAVERLQRRLDEYAGVPPNTLPLTTERDNTPSSVSTGGAVLMSLLALAIGWSIGSSYTRRQERGRRSRIRF